MTSWEDYFYEDHFADRYTFQVGDRSDLTLSPFIGLRLLGTTITWEDRTAHIDPGWVMASAWVIAGRPSSPGVPWSLSIGFQQRPSSGEETHFAGNLLLNSGLPIPPYWMQLGGSLGDAGDLPYQEIYPPADTCPSWESLNPPPGNDEPSHVMVRISLLTTGAAMLEMGVRALYPHRTAFLADGARLGSTNERFPGMTIGADMSPMLRDLLPGLVPFVFISGGADAPNVIAWGYDIDGAQTPTPVIPGTLNGGAGSHGQLRVRPVN